MTGPIDDLNRLSAAANDGPRHFRDDTGHDDTRIQFGDKGDLTHTGAVDLAAARCAVRDLLRAFGLDPENVDFADTPRRVSEQYSELFAGLYMAPPKMTVFATDIDNSEVVLLKDIFFTSVCSHHLAPFVGRASVAYVPDHLLSGLSKLARIVDYFAARPQLQERMATQIADFITTKLRPRGVAVVLRGSHGCVATRGAMKAGSEMVTTVMRGCFADSTSRYREDLLHAMRDSK